MKVRVMTILVLGMYVLSCAKVQQQDSELTLLMREMFDDGMRIKDQIQKGEELELENYKKRLLAAHSTDPEVAKSQAFRSFAINYLAAAEALGQLPDVPIATQFERVVDRCMDCHKSLCPGPMVRIEKLYMGDGGG